RKEPWYLIAVCSDGAIPAPPGSVLVDASGRVAVVPNESIREQERAITQLRSEAERVGTEVAREAARACSAERSLNEGLLRGERCRTTRRCWWSAAATTSCCAGAPRSRDTSRAPRTVRTPVAIRRTMPRRSAGWKRSGRAARGTWCFRRRRSGGWTTTRDSLGTCAG